MSDLVGTPNCFSRAKSPILLEFFLMDIFFCFQSIHDVSDVIGESDLEKLRSLVKRADKNDSVMIEVYCTIIFFLF